jgi:hypothetical protein
VGFIDKYVQIRPYAYHVSQRANLARLARTRRLESSANLIRRADESELLRRRRDEPTRIQVDGDTVILQDQLPLVFASAQLAEGWSEGDFVEFINEHVFFWPGTAHGPIKYGDRLLEHYEEQGPAVLRVRTRALLSANPGMTPLFCPFNSGATRMQGGRRVSRGPDLFMPARSFPRTPGKAVELVFAERSSFRRILSIGTLTANGVHS